MTPAKPPHLPPHMDDLEGGVRSGDVDPESALAVVAELMASPEEMQAMQEQQKREAENRRMRLHALGARLSNEAQEQVRLRQTTEERWFNDVRQYNGQYAPDFFSGASAYSSRAFVPLTRRLVNLCEARLFDMLFQSDTRFYDIKPSPVPEIDRAQKLADSLPGEMPIETPEGMPLQVGALSASIKALMDEATTRADGMRRQIDDQLAASKFPTIARNMIHDALLFGTGVIKGPIPMMKERKSWQLDQSTGAHVLVREQYPAPIVQHVSVWNFFPDMSATSMEECERVYERHFLTKMQLTKLRDLPEVDLDALRSLLETEPGQAQADNHRERLRAISGANGAQDLRYEVWEYTGPISAQDLMDCGCEDMGDVDPLEQVCGSVWFCDGVVLKAALSPMDTWEIPYRVFTWQKDESSIFGFGLPYEVADQQMSANSAWRGTLDNMGLCVLPQVVIDDAGIEPVTGGYGIEPGKFWRNKRSGSNAQQAIQFISIDSRVQELQGIFVASKQLIEEVGTLPAFMQGQDAPGKLQSATEASISWTAANLWVRRCVRNWDDDVIMPLIRGYYDWNMQWGDDPSIKGDLEVVAMGASSLVEMEGQAQRLTQLAQAAQQMGIPLSTNYAMLRELSRALKLDPDRWLPTETEIKKMKEQEQQNGPQPDPEMMKLQVAKENNAMDHQLGMATLQLKRDEIAARQQDMQARMQLEMAQAAASQNITQQEAMRKYGFDTAKVTAELQDRQAERDHKAQMLNAEMQFAAQSGSGV